MLHIGKAKCLGSCTVKKSFPYSISASQCGALVSICSNTTTSPVRLCQNLDVLLVLQTNKFPVVKTVESAGCHLNIQYDSFGTKESFKT